MSQRRRYYPVAGGRFRVYNRDRTDPLVPWANKWYAHELVGGEWRPVYADSGGWVVDRTWGRLCDARRELEVKP